MDNISVSIQPTNTSTILKFVHTSTITNGSYEYNNIDEAKNSVLAQQLFHLPFVKKIYITANFIAIERYDIIEWVDVQEEVKSEIERYLNDGNLIIDAEVKSTKKVAIEIYAESTPNPSVMKFVANRMLTSQTFEFKNIDEAKEAPLAIELFRLPFIKEVFISENYVSVAKFDIAEWSEVANEVRSFIRQYIADGNIILNENIVPKIIKSLAITAEDLDETSQQIIDILDEYIRPAVASDGGNIQFESYDEKSKTVNVILQGACSGCPSSTMTLKSGIETMLKEMIPNKIESVIAING
ncbi:MAG: Fe-S cluster biogenesis protein NfuA [Urechidicola sp.]|jgi:Fe-S cluster biogenesis protein NfuA|tara:strand:+ start:145 stop:1038 length:894 start_codon:yes stop_codon:yes gene_type:complete